ncbi:MAG: tRNA (guanosine(37)-N1)-methyltransferase TrmD [bacterium]|nr:tRNA (guanosine(37)-N1)-methyltransferase TrmD [bacterium]
MLKIDVITIFPEIFNDFLETSIIKRAQDKQIVELKITDLRKYAIDKQKKVDDEAYGGGAGMVLKPEPVIRAIRDLKKDSTRVILLSPQGTVFKQQFANNYAKADHLILVCGRYEGFDERILGFVDDEVSLGDFVLNGGEVPAMVVIEAVTRLLPEVLGNKESFLADSFYEKNILDYPHYTRPFEFENLKVPDVLVSGNHANIAAWREQQALLNTFKKRPELLRKEQVKKIKQIQEIGMDKELD